MTIDDSAKATKPVKGLVKRGVVAVQVEAKEEEGLLIDQLGERLESLQLLRGRGDESSTNQLLEAFGSSGAIEDQMLKELSSKEPLHHTERFDEAHRQAMRALEVFDRNGSRP